MKSRKRRSSKQNKMKLHMKKEGHKLAMKVRIIPIEMMMTKRETN